MARILLGKPVAEKIYQSLEIDTQINLGVILVGEDRASLAYIKSKERIAQKLGINFKLFQFSGISQEPKILDLIGELNRNQKFQGIVVQLPLPEDFDTDKILKEIAPNKDIDGFSGHFPPPTAEAILEMLEFYGIELKGKKIVIVGYGRLVGRPLEKLLKTKGYSPIICSSSTGGLAGELLDADIIVAATGHSNLIKPNMVSEKAVIIDAGTAESRGKIAGDVHPKVYEKIAAYSPVPGGVGPVTVACLMKNLVEVAKKN